MTYGHWILRDLLKVEPDRSAAALFDLDNGGFEPTAREAFGEELLDERQGIDILATPR